MVSDPGRPQDQGRTHRRRGSPSPATRALLDRYHAALRDQLGALLDELEPKMPAPGLLDGELAATPQRPTLERAGKLWDLAVKLARELGAEIDPAPPQPSRGSQGSDATGPAKRRGRVEW